MQHLTTVRYWAALKEAAGCPEEAVDAATLADALAQVTARHDARFAAVLARCSLLLDGAQVGTRDPETVSLEPGALLDCLPPFAGG